MLRANKHAVLQQSHLVGSELHPLCNTATTGHSEGFHTTGHTLLWALFNTLLLQSLALKRRSPGSVWAGAWWWWGGRSSCAGHGGAAGGTSGTLGHGKAPGLAHPVCTHQPRVFQHVCSFAVLPYATSRWQYLTNTVNLSSLNSCLCTKMEMGTQLFRQCFFCNRPIILPMHDTKGERTSFYFLGYPLQVKCSCRI